MTRSSRNKDEHMVGDEVRWKSWLANKGNDGVLCRSPVLDYISDLYPPSHNKKYLLPFLSTSAIFPLLLSQWPYNTLRPPSHRESNPIPHERAYRSPTNCDRYQPTHYLGYHTSSQEDFGQRTKEQSISDLSSACCSRLCHDDPRSPPSPAY